MKTKEKEIQKKITELSDLMGEDDKFFMFRKNDNVVDIALPSGNGKVKDVDVSAALASVLEAYLLGNGGKGVDRISEIIISAIEAVVGVSPDAGAKLTSRFAMAALIGMKSTLDKFKSEDDENEEEQEDCEGCELVRTCNNDSAIKYRREHGIPKPKKGKKGGRKVDVN